MAYEKQTWECDEIITAEKLNHMEEGIADADNGYECSASATKSVIYDGDVTTQGMGSTGNMGDIYPDEPFQEYATLDVTFEGTLYECEVRVRGNERTCGAENGFDFSEYPFTLIFTPQEGIAYVYTELPGTYSIKIEGAETIVTTSPCFEMAVAKIVSRYIGS